MPGLFSLLIGLGMLGIVVAAGCVAFRQGRFVVQDVLANREPLPAWFEAVMPLKGRWLRLLVAAPGIAVFVSGMFVAVLYAGMIVGGLLLWALWFLVGLVNPGFR